MTVRSTLTAIVAMTAASSANAAAQHDWYYLEPPDAMCTQMSTADGRQYQRVDTPQKLVDELRREGGAVSAEVKKDDSGNVLLVIVHASGPTVPNGGVLYLAPDKQTCEQMQKSWRANGTVPASKGLQ